MVLAAFEGEPRLHRRAAPLGRCVAREALRHHVLVEREAIQHQREVGIGDAPLAEEVLRALRQERVGGGKECLRGGLGFGGQGLQARAEKTTVVLRSMRSGIRSLRTHAWIWRARARSSMPRG